MAETTNSVSRFAAFQKQYTDNPAGFVADGRKVIKSIAKYLDGADQVKTDHKVLGIQFTVLAKEWFGGLMMTPVWIGKDLKQFLAFRFNIGADDYFPKLALDNCRLINALVVPTDTKGNAMPCLFPEDQYLKSKQQALDYLRRVALHPTVQDGKGNCNPENPDLKEAIRLAISREEGFMKGLKAIVAKLEGKEAKSKSALSVMDALEMVIGAIPTLGDMPDEEAKAFYVKAAMIGDMLTYGSGIADETQTEWFAEVVLPENVQKAKADEEAAQVAKAKAAAESVALAKAKAAMDAATPTPVETTAPDIRAWVVANYPQSVDGEIEAGISLATDFLKSEGRLPANAAELDQYAEHTLAAA